MSTAEKIDGINATRMELLDLRNRKKLAEDGYELLNKKLETLTNELFTILQTYREVQRKIQEAIQDAVGALTITEMAMGSLKVREVALNFEKSIRVEASSRSLMGVRVPIIKMQKKETNQPYSFIDTSVRLDEAIKKFQIAIEIIVKLAEVQSTISRLATEIQSTKRRVNALKNIVIPRFDVTLRWISLTLGEQEREEFVRLKKVKSKLEQKNK
ncbi:MAG: V-type ATP synthase subunit D [Candidatus Hodarchaeales archaeon]|jgi:V/A-type H+-transporting ATPase subunit D